jgi:hypothetical protein
MSTPPNIALVDDLYEFKFGNGAAASFYTTCSLSSRPERRAFQTVDN